MANFWESQILTGSTSVIHVAEETLARLKALGVNLRPSNRLERARALLQRIQDRELVLKPEDDSLLERVSEAQIDILEQYMIARASEGRSGGIPPSHKGKLEEMLSGADIEDEDRNPQGRNTQFELYVAAVLTMGGATILPGEPDWRIRNGLMEAGIAAKRLTSTAKFSERVHEAEKQIERHTGRGFVAVNIDAFVKRIESEPPEQNPEEQFERFSSKVEKLKGSIRPSLAVMGILFFGHTTEFAFTGDRPRISTFEVHSFQLYGEDEEERSWGIRFGEIQRLMKQRFDGLQGE